MKLYVELSVLNSRFNSITGKLYYYLFETRCWVEWANIHKDGDRYYVNVWA